jgi:hypothetical protein
MAMHKPPHNSRIARASSQYEVALRHWNPSGRVLVLAHLYMAAEALGPVVEEVRRDALGISMPDHARRLGVDSGGKRGRRSFRLASGASTSSMAMPSCTRLPSTRVTV